MAFDNAQTLNCYKLRAFILLSMSGYHKTSSLFQQFSRLAFTKFVDFDPFWFLFPIHNVECLCYCCF